LATSIGLLSGTFDPVHRGHVALAQAALRQLQLDEVWLLVNAYAQHKAGIAPFEHRLAMAALASAGVPGVVADREPVQRVPQRHSVAMMRQLERNYPRHRFTLIMGVEVFGGLDRWEEVEELVQLVPFGVVLRRASDNALIEQLKQRLGPAASNLEYDFIAMPGVPVSSTAVRRALQTGRMAAGLHPPVRDYIGQHHLYS